MYSSIFYEKYEIEYEFEIFLQTFHRLSVFFEWVRAMSKVHLESCSQHIFMVVAYICVNIQDGQFRPPKYQFSDIFWQRFNGFETSRSTVG